MALIPAVVLAFTNQAHALNVYTVTWNATDATQNIIDKIDDAREAAVPSRIILEYHSTPWYVNTTILLDVPNMEIWVKGGATVMAKRYAQAFIDGQIPLFRIAANGVTMRGYANFFDDTDGVATLRMWKSDYPSGDESRHCISIRALDVPASPYVNNTTIKGFLIEQSGGDGIIINSQKNSTIPPYNVVVKDVTCDDNHRQGMSVISVDKLTVTSCVFKNTGLTGGTAPMAGVDIEPSTSNHVLKQVKFVDCEFRNNGGNNVEIRLENLSAPGIPPIDITFDNCLIDGGPKNGIGFFALKPAVANGPTGTIAINDITIRNMGQSAMLFGGWNSADRVTTTITDMSIVDCNPDGTKSLILFSKEADSHPDYRLGDIAFNGVCEIHDENTVRTANTAATVRATLKVQGDEWGEGPKNITGAITAYRPIATTAESLVLGPYAEDCSLDVTEVDVP